MSFLRQLDAVPAYHAHGAENRSIPFIVALLFQDRDGLARLTPAVEAAINHTVEITGRHGLVTAIVSEQDTKTTVAGIVERTMAINDAILLFRCQNAETAEALMQCMDDFYCLSLVKRSGCADRTASVS